MTLNIEEARRAIEINFAAGISVEVRGASGIGKSEMAEDYADAQGPDYGLFELNAATANLPDVMGVLMPGTETHIDVTGEPVTLTTGRYAYPYFFRDKRTGRPAFTYSRGMLLIEEYGQASVDLKRGLASLIWSGHAGEHKLPANCNILLLSNRPEDRSGVTRDFDFLINRRNILDARAELDPWLVWAHAHNVSNVSLAYAARNTKDVFSNVAPKVQGPWMTPRSLVTADKFITEAQHFKYDLDDPFVRQNINGIVGEGYAHTYIGFAKIRDKLPTMKQILDDPQGCRIPDEMDQVMFLVFDLASKSTKANISQIIQYIHRMPSDMSITYYRSAMQRDSALRSTKEFGDWSVKNIGLLSAIASAR